MSWYQVQVGRRLPVDPGIGRPERDLSGLRVDQPPVLVAGLVGQRGSDLLQIQAAQLKHGTSIDPCLNHKRCTATRRTGGMSARCLSACKNSNPRAVLGQE
jgi:hypothetical protein